VLGVVRDLRSPRSLDTPGEAAAYQEHLLAEYVLARLAHGVADGTIRGEIAAVEQFLDQAGVPAWEVEPAHADRFLGQAQRHQAPGTRRGKAKAIDLFFRFLEARYRGEICELTGRVVASPVDDCNRPRHSGDFLVSRHLVALRVAEFLTDQGLARADPRGVLEQRLERRLAALPAPFAAEVRTWTEALHGRGPRAGPPATRARSRRTCASWRSRWPHGRRAMARCARSPPKT
jgi:hypothetical protein